MVSRKGWRSTDSDQHRSGSFLSFSLLPHLCFFHIPSFARGRKKGGLGRVPMIPLCYISKPLLITGPCEWNIKLISYRLIVVQSSPSLLSLSVCVFSPMWASTDQISAKSVPCLGAASIFIERRGPCRQTNPFASYSFLFLGRKRIAPGISQVSP